MGCNCNKKPDHWSDLEWVSGMAQKMADIKQSSQVVYRENGGYIFIDEEEYRGTASIVILEPERTNQP